MGLINLTVHPRSETGKNANRRLRDQGRTPAIIYGDKREDPIVSEVDTAEFRKALASFSGQFPVFSLQHSDGSQSTVAVLREVQRHPVSDTIYHCDLFEIPADRELEMEVVLDYVGENRAVKSGDGLLEIAQRTVQVMCLPAELPDQIAVDISGLAVGDKVTPADIENGSVKILTDPEEVLAKINPNTLALEEDIAAEGEEGEEEGAEAAEGEEAPAEEAAPESE